MPDNERWNETGEPALTPADQASPEGRAAGSAFAPRPGRRVRIIGEPLFSLGDLVAGIVILIMVCGPLALGAFGV